MKVYTQQFACETPVQNRFYCPPNSMFKVGVKVLKGGEELSGVTLSSGGQALSADEDKYFGWTTWTLQSLGPGSTEYVVGASGTEQKFKIQQVASDGTVFDMDATGGAVPADVATQGYVQEYVDGQVSDFVTESDVQGMGFQTLDDITAMGFTTADDVTAIAGGMGFTTNDDVTAIVNPVEIKVDNLSGEVGMLTGIIYDSADAISYISSEVSADVDSTNVKHISACYLTDYVELSTSGTPDPDTLYFCVG